MMFASLEVPSVTVASACVSPRVNIDDHLYQLKKRENLNIYTFAENEVFIF